jgi:mRNA interferase MazF
MQQNAETAQHRKEPRLVGAPKIRQLLWCDFPRDAQLPEFWKTRPVVVLSYRNRLSGCVTVVPCSTLDQTKNPWAVDLPFAFTDRPTWAICDKLTSVAVSRLSMDGSGVVRVPVPCFDSIVRLVLEWLPAPSGART